MTGSPRSSARQYRPASYSALDRKPRSSRSRLLVVEGLLGGLVLDELDAVEVPSPRTSPTIGRSSSFSRVARKSRARCADVTEQVLPLEQVEVGQRDGGRRRGGRRRCSRGRTVGAALERLEQAVGRSSRRAASSREVRPLAQVMMSGT